MTARERNEAGPEADPADPEVGRSRGGSPSEGPDAGRPTDQAIINQDQALESGEENVVSCRATSSQFGWLRRWS
jgi:hypothetical protein